MFWSGAKLPISEDDRLWVEDGFRRLSTMLGRRRMLLIGLAIFAVSSLTAGLAHSAGLLVAARLVQGLGAALMAPAALSALTTTINA